MEIFHEISEKYVEIHIKRQFLFISEHVHVNFMTNLRIFNSIQKDFEVIFFTPQYSHFIAFLLLNIFVKLWKFSTIVESLVTLAPKGRMVIQKLALARR